VENGDQKNQEGEMVDDQTANQTDKPLKQHTKKLNK
jgi:hypothetical protein